MLPYLFYETNAKLIPKLRTTQENYRPVSVLNMDTNILNKFLVNWPQKKHKKDHTMIKTHLAHHEYKEFPQLIKKKNNYKTPQSHNTYL